MNKILIVDDCMYSIKIIQTTMTSLGYEVIVAYNGKEGIIKAVDELPNLVFMDISMPIMDGIESMKRIKEMHNLKNVPLIAYTAYSLKGDREKLLDEGFDEYLPKPVSVSNLINMAQKHLEQTGI